MTVTAENPVVPVVVNNTCLIKITDITTSLSSEEISEQQLEYLRNSLCELLQQKACLFTGFQDIYEYLEHFSNGEKKGQYIDHQCEVAFRFETDIEEVESIIDNIAAHGLTFTLLVFIPNKEYTKAVRSWRVTNARVAARIHDTNVRDRSKINPFGMMVIIRHLMDVDGNYPFQVDRDTKWGTEELEKINAKALIFPKETDPK